MTEFFFCGPSESGCNKEVSLVELFLITFRRLFDIFLLVFNLLSSESDPTTRQQPHVQFTWFLTGRVMMEKTTTKLNVNQTVPSTVRLISL